MFLFMSCPRVRDQTPGPPSRTARGRTPHPAAPDECLAQLYRSFFPRRSHSSRNSHTLPPNCPAYFTNIGRRIYVGSGASRVGFIIGAKRRGSSLEATMQQRQTTTDSGKIRMGGQSPSLPTRPTADAGKVRTGGQSPSLVR